MQFSPTRILPTLFKCRTLLTSVAFADVCVVCAKDNTSTWESGDEKEHFSVLNYREFFYFDEK
jgi:hypothetical protein